MPARYALQNYLIAIRQVTAADSAWLLFCSASRRHAPLLLSEGDLPILPELADSEASKCRGSDEPRPDFPDEDPEHPPLLQVQSSSAADGYLIRVDISRLQRLFAQRNHPESKDKRSSATPLPPEGAEGGLAWIGLRYSASSGSSGIADRLLALGQFRGTPSHVRDDGLPWTLALSTYLAWEAYQLSVLQQDPISLLPGRVRLQACLAREFEKAATERYPLGLVLLNPDEFGLVNHRLGREKGDSAVQEVAANLSSNSRRSDMVFRYGGAVFAVLMPGSGVSAANAAAEKLRRTLTQRPYLDNAARFAFSAGVAVYEPTADTHRTAEPSDLLRRADQALNAAKLSGGARTVLWSPDGSQTGAGSLDRLSGIFTADTEKDYRNMLLLWDTITVISSQADTDTIAAEFVDRIGSIFKPETVGLFSRTDADSPQLLAASTKGGKGEDRRSKTAALELSPEQCALLDRARRQGRIERSRLAPGPNGRRSGAKQKKHLAYAVPLLARDRCIGFLYIDGPEETLSLDTSDLTFLNALASQIAVALDRAELASRWKAEKEQESLRLRQQVRELRQALDHTRLVYRSSQMDAVLDTLRKVAPTDVTVLISGESGTGKEMLARTLHELSARHNKPFVTVDCGAIAHSLIDAELFGHLKGSYTGAQAGSPGRIAQAEGGTLFLDEVGELPLEVQTKLLRFLQEKEIVPVGATRPVRVDVRIVAATNRDLAEEVVAGRFRSDLYYRLQVVTAHAPPLRERPEDILPLARYFLERFSADYGKSPRTLAPAAQDALTAYPWLGNVRELQHRILQAVVMSDTEVIAEAELRLRQPTEAPTHGGAETALPTVAAGPAASAQPAFNAPTGPRPGGPAVGLNGCPWEALRHALRRQVNAALERKRAPVPLGKWLAEDLVLAADEANDNTARRACSALGMAETTFRRRVEKVKREFHAGLIARTEDWSEMVPILSRLVVANATDGGGNVFDRAREILLEEVLAHVEDNNTIGAALMGVTAPTYRRWTAALRS